MSTDITSNNPNPQTINMGEESAPMNGMSRREASDKRKNDFFKELEAARAADQTPFTSGSTAKEHANDSATSSEESRESNSERQQENDPALDVENDDDDVSNSKYIPKSRLDKEIAKRKAEREDLTKQLQEEREARIRFETKQSMLDEAFTKLNRAPEQNHEIDPVDMEAHSLYMKEINALKAQHANSTKANQEYQVRQQFAQTVDKQADDFRRNNPDFDDAYNHIINVKKEEAFAMGYEGQEATNYAMSQLQPIAWKAYEKGMNVAEVAYNLANKYGYKSKEGAPKTANRDLSKVEGNMAKSHSSLNEIKAVPTKLSTPEESALEMEVFNRNYSGARGRGVDAAKFKALLNNVGKQNRY